MNISEKAAYLKGLMDGLKLDTDSSEGKMISAIVDRGVCQDILSHLPAGTEWRGE